MKKTIIGVSTIVFIALSLFGFVLYINRQNDIQVYSFSGESNNIAINNGAIIITNNLEKFIGGDLSFKNKIPDIKNSALRYYFLKDGADTIIQENIDITGGFGKGTNLQQDTGSSSSEDLFYGNDLEFIKKSLYFSLKGTFMNGEKFEYIIALKVKRIY